MRNIGYVLSPFGHINSVLDKIIDDFQPPATMRSTSGSHLEETEKHYLLSIDLPGVPKDQIEIEVVENELTIVAKRGEREFKRVFSLPSDVKLSEIEAESVNGVLSILIPKVEIAKPRKIKIKGSVPSEKVSGDEGLDLPE